MGTYTCTYSWDGGFHRVYLLVLNPQITIVYSFESREFLDGLSLALERDSTELNTGSLQKVNSRSWELSELYQHKLFKNLVYQSINIPLLISNKLTAQLIGVSDVLNKYGWWLHFTPKVGKNRF